MRAKTSPVDTRDVAEVIATILANPTGHVGKVYELTGPQSLDMDSLAAEYGAALHRPVQYTTFQPGQWQDELRSLGLPEHLFHHLLTMADLHAANRYDRLTYDVEKITGRPATSVRDFVATTRGSVSDEIVLRGKSIGGIASQGCRQEPIASSLQPTIAFDTIMHSKGD